MVYFFICYLAAARLTIGPLSRRKPHSPDVNLGAFIYLRFEGQWEPRNEVGSLSPAECLVGIELGNFQFKASHSNSDKYLE